MALESWHKQVIKVGLKGEFSPHSLRYAWAQDAIRHYLAQGFSEKESLALTATDLGHGDGRGVSALGETGVWLPLEEGMTEFMNGSK